MHSGRLAKRASTRKRRVRGSSSPRSPLMRYDTPGVAVHGASPAMVSHGCGTAARFFARTTTAGQPQARAQSSADRHRSALTAKVVGDERVHARGVIAGATGAHKGMCGRERCAHRAKPRQRWALATRAVAAAGTTGHDSKCRHHNVRRDGCCEEIQQSLGTALNQQLSHGSRVLRRSGGTATTVLGASQGASGTTTQRVAHHHTSTQPVAHTWNNTHRLCTATRLRIACHTGGVVCGSVIGGGAAQLISENLFGGSGPV